MITTGILCDGVGDCPIPVEVHKNERATWGKPPGFPDDECWIRCPIKSIFGCTNQYHGIVGGGVGVSGMLWCRYIVRAIFLFCAVLSLYTVNFSDYLIVQMCVEKKLFS